MEIHDYLDSLSKRERYTEKTNAITFDDEVKILFSIVFKRGGKVGGWIWVEMGIFLHQSKEGESGCHAKLSYENKKILYELIDDRG